MMIERREFRVGIFARDFRTSIQFYQQALGGTLERTWDRGAGDSGAVLTLGDGRIELIPASPTATPLAEQSGIWLYIEVADVDVAYARAMIYNATIVSPPTDELWGHRRFRLRDPDGVRIGLFSHLPAK
jgi:uncharacterized glyoxalase superfamily protein PhnB